MEQYSISKLPSLDELAQMSAKEIHELFDPKYEGFGIKEGRPKELWTNDGFYAWLFCPNNKKPDFLKSDGNMRDVLDHLKPYENTFLFYAGDNHSFTQRGTNPILGVFIKGKPIIPGQLTIPLMNTYFWDYCGENQMRVVAGYNSRK